jgi:hypothetical protein
MGSLRSSALAGLVGEDDDDEADDEGGGEEGEDHDGRWTVVRPSRAA